MNRLLPFMIEFIRDEQGASAVEYSVLILLIILVALAAIQVLGMQVESAFDTFVERFSAAASN